MSHYLELVRQQSELHRDLKIEPMQVGSENVWMVGYESLVNWQETILHIHNSCLDPAASYSEICTRLAGKEWRPEEMDELLQGRVVLIDARSERAFSF